MSNLANVDMPRIVGGDLLRVPDIAHAIRQDRRRLNQQPGCLGASLERTEEGKSWAGTVKSELFEKPNAGRRRQPDAGRRMAETTWAVHLILEQLSARTPQGRRHKSTDEARIITQRPDVLGWIRAWGPSTLQIGPHLMLAEQYYFSRSAHQDRHVSVFAKLQVRWWHGQFATMDRILRRVGAPRQVCEFIK